MHLNQQSITSAQEWQQDESQLKIHLTQFMLRPAPAAASAAAGTMAGTRHGWYQLSCS
jgi:hypothetical protein